MFVQTIDSRRIGNTAWWYAYYQLNQDILHDGWTNSTEINQHIIAQILLKRPLKFYNVLL